MTFYDKDKNISFEENIATVSFDDLMKICTDSKQPFERLSEDYKNELSSVDSDSYLVFTRLL